MKHKNEEENIIGNKISENIKQHNQLTNKNGKPNYPGTILLYKHGNNNNNNNDTKDSEPKIEPKLLYWQSWVRNESNQIKISLSGSIQLHYAYFYFILFNNLNFIIIIIGL